jgi:7-keto-8-aminopelargonate synthetase-like enzyme
MGAAICAIEIVKSEPERREKLWRLVKRFKAGLERLGLEVLPSNSAFVPVLIGRVEGALSFSSSLMKQGVFTPAIRPPSVPIGKSRIRATLMATHTEEHVDWALRAFEAAREVL